MKNFGKIEDASVEVAPLTLFVGDNNSGKSYMMTLIYGLLTVNFFFDKYEFYEQSIAYQQCSQFIDRIIETKHEEFYELEADDLLAFQNLLNEVINQNCSLFLRKLFNREMSIGEIRISFPSEMKTEFRIRKRPDD